MNRRQFILNSSVLLSSSVGAIIADAASYNQRDLPHTAKMPVLFVGHGSPMNAIVKNSYHLEWSNLGRRLPKPSAILVVSAHWRSLGVTRIMSTPEPEIIHDFSGFPEELYDQQYPAPGSPAAAELTHQLLQIPSESGSSIESALDDFHDLDHGAWSVLLAMYPEADIPVFQISIDIEKPAEFHYAVGQQLAALRERGVLILGSGNMVHNLHASRLPGNQPYDWALSLENYLSTALQDHDDKQIIDAPEHLSELMTLGHPTLEHFQPLLYALGAKSTNDKLAFFNVGYSSSSVSMRSVLYTS